ncbi:Zn-ribbon domain-containing protein [Nanoarchaeota archaeon]
MPHQCVRCNTFYEDGAAEIIKGCSCGSRLFFFVKKSALEKAKEVTENLTEEDKTQIESDVLDLVGQKKDEPVILDFESIRINKPGQFELDLVRLFNKDNPLVYKLAEGKYVIDIPETFQRRTEIDKE